MTPFRIRYLSLLVLVGCVARIVSGQMRPDSQPGQMLIGGTSVTRLGDANSQKAAQTIRSQITAQLGVPKFDVFQVLEYTTQVVAGINWTFKILAGYDGQRTIFQIAAFQQIGKMSLSLSKLRWSQY